MCEQWCAGMDKGLQEHTAVFADLLSAFINFVASSSGVVYIYIHCLIVS